MGGSAWKPKRSVAADGFAAAAGFVSFCVIDAASVVGHAWFG